MDNPLVIILNHYMYQKTGKGGGAVLIFKSLQDFSKLYNPDTLSVMTS